MDDLLLINAAEPNAGLREAPYTSGSEMYVTSVPYARHALQPIYGVARARARAFLPTLRHRQVQWRQIRCPDDPGLQAARRLCG